MATLILFGVAVVCLFLSFYLWMSKKFRYWKDRGVPHLPVVPIFGNCLPLFRLKYSMGDYFKHVYDSYPDLDYVGFYGLTEPHLIIRSPKLVERILVKDFGYFVDHGLEVDETKNWIDLSLFNLTGNRWRAVRNKVSPTFTSGKLKLMMEEMVVCANNLVRRLEQTSGQNVDVKDTLTSYSTEVVASIAFGLDVADWEKAREFRTMGKKVLDMNVPRYLAFLCLLFLPWLGHALNGRLTPTDVAKYFSNIIMKNFDHRTQNKVQRNDFVQLLLQLKQKGTVEYVTKDPDDDYLRINSDSGGVQSFEMTDKVLIAQAFTFIMAGFDAMSSALMFAVYELAINPDIQERVRNEVWAMKEKHEGFTYQALKEMTYLDQCIQESMRLHPLVSFVLRICTKRYRVDESLTLDEGTRIIVPLLALQTDPKYYPDPYKFDPERFGPESNRVSFTYLPFGEGPRMCIGMRFAMLQMKYAIVRILDEFIVKPSQIGDKIEYKINSIIAMPKNRIDFVFKKIK